MSAFAGYSAAPAGRACTAGPLEDKGEAFLDLVERSLSRPLSVKFQVSDFEARCRMVREGLGIAMMPQSVGRAHIKALCLVQIPLKDDWAVRQFFVCVRDDKNLKAAASDLLAQLIQSGRNHGEVTRKKRS